MLSASLVDFLHVLASSQRPNSRQLPSVREETATKKVHKLLLEGTKIINSILILTYDGLIFLVGSNLTNLVRQNQVW